MLLLQKVLQSQRPASHPEPLKLLSRKKILPKYKQNLILDNLKKEKSFLYDTLLPSKPEKYQRERRKQNEKKGS